MAQAGYTPILIYGSGTASAVPINTNLTSSANGAELALNYADGKLYYKDNAGAVQLLASKAGASGSVTSVNVSGGTTGLTTSGGPVTTSGTITLAGTLVVANGGTGLSTTTAYGLIAAGTTSTGNFQQVSGTGTSGQVLTSNGAGALPTWQAGASGNVTTSGNNAFTGANTFYNATGQTFAQASTNDGIILQGRAGGSSSYRVTFTTATLSANRTLTFPDATDTAAVLGTAQTFTAAQTFRAANAIRSEAASTQDAVIIAGRAGGTSSYAITLTPATLSASRTLTLPEPGEDVTLGYLNVPQNAQTGSYTLVLADAGKHIYRGSGSAATWTIPANSSVAYPIGTALTFINLSATSVSIAITTDTMYLSSAGTTGTRTLAQYGSATAVKITSTSWIISGSGLT